MNIKAGRGGEWGMGNRERDIWITDTTKKTLFLSRNALSNNAQVYNT